MKREFLKEMGVEDALIDRILDENSRDIGREKQNTDNAKAKLAEAHGKLINAQNELDQLKASNGNAAEIQKKLDNLQAKYDADIADRDNRLAARDYDDAISRAIARKNLRFHSKLEESAFKTLLKEKNLEIKDGELEGFDDFIKEQKDADPDAFAPEKPAPKIVGPTGGGSIPPSTHQTVAEQLAASIGKAKAESGKAANNVISMYTKGDKT